MLICTQTWLRSPSALVVNQIFISRLKCTELDSIHVLFAQPCLCLTRRPHSLLSCALSGSGPARFWLLTKLGSEPCFLMFSNEHQICKWLALAAQTSFDQLDQHSPLPTECTFLLIVCRLSDCLNWGMTAIDKSSPLMQTATQHSVYELPRLYRVQLRCPTTMSLMLNQMYAEYHSPLYYYASSYSGSHDMLIGRYCIVKA